LGLKNDLTKNINKNNRNNGSHNRGGMDGKLSDIQSKKKLRTMPSMHDIMHVIFNVSFLVSFIIALKKSGERYVGSISQDTSFHSVE